MAILMIDSFDQKDFSIDWEQMWPRSGSSPAPPNLLAALLANGTAGVAEGEVDNRTGVNVILPEGAFTITPIKAGNGVVSRWEVVVHLPEELCS